MAVTSRVHPSNHLISRAHTTPVTALDIAGDGKVAHQLTGIATAGLDTIGIGMLAHGLPRMVGNENGHPQGLKDEK